MKNIPTTLVLFGATGNLVARKILPALFELYDRELLPDKFRVVGFSRTDMDLEQFRNHVAKMHEEHSSSLMISDKWPSFIRLFSYQKGNFENKKDYKALISVLKEIDKGFQEDSNKLFYLAVPPLHYEDILLNLSSSYTHLRTHKGSAKTKILVEKPFGRNLKTSRKLDRLLARLFSDEQIYRIDHYLAKEMVQSVLSFRFSNSIFESNWNRNHIESVYIRALEDVGVEKRGGFYDDTGALRDFGQNHLLQMLALVAMEHPQKMDARAIRNNRRKILSSIVAPDAEYIRKNTFRAQYEGYKQILGVRPDSTRETYFKIKTYIKSPKFKGVPFYLESGKRLGKDTKDITVNFKHPSECLCAGRAPHRNSIVFSLAPKEEINIHMGIKKIGYKFELEDKSIKLALRENGNGTVSEYEKLLLDCIYGDQTLFTSTEEVRAMWRFIDPIIAAWEANAVPLKFYKPDSADILDEAKVIE
ncbi:MAG: glucose-6-phosphate dehydrogenase [Candidatus Colwellbacteria bacterium]|nr:glucose-6-phosphate dehydrogenase [Candidatus Colwellbacteria bacterium]